MGIRDRVFRLELTFLQHIDFAELQNTQSTSIATFGFGCTRSKARAQHIGYRGWFSWERTLYDLLVCSGDKLGGPRDSMGCLDNILHPKPTKHGSYKY